MGDGEVLLWPSDVAMQALYALSRPRNQILEADLVGVDLLWPASLINRQARARKRRSLALPVAVLAFVCSIVLAVVVGPIQLILLAFHSADYNWVTEIYFPEALRYALLGGAVVAAIDLAVLAMLWQRRDWRNNAVPVMVFGSLTEVILVWLLGSTGEWQPHQVSLILIAVMLVFVVIVLFVGKQEVLPDGKSALARVMLGCTAVSAVVLMLGCLNYFWQTADHTDQNQLNEISAKQVEARVEGVLPVVSDVVFTLCESGKYQVVYQAEDLRHGMYECVGSGDVYSVGGAVALETNRSWQIDALATYLGTTKNHAVTMAFPNAYYLYRSIPQVLKYDELVLMVPAGTEREFLDNITVQMLEYWQANNGHNLHLSAFYSNDISAIMGTKDYILVAALETMAASEKLPKGNIIKGVYDGRMANYIFKPETELVALNELGLHPEAYANSSLHALTTHRHISVWLEAGEEFDYDTLHAKLEGSLVNASE